MEGQSNLGSSSQPTDDEATQAKAQAFLREIQARQNLTFGILGGLVAAAIGAALWAIVTVITGVQIGWMAVGVGALVGVAVRIFGKGITKAFGVVGAILALLGCLAGNILSVCIFASREWDVPLLQLLGALDLKILVELLKATFSPIDVLFYGFAVYQGYKYSFRKVTAQEMANVVTPTPQQ